MSKVLMTGSNQLSEFGKDTFAKKLRQEAPEAEFVIENRIVPQEEMVHLLKDVDILVTWDQPVDEYLLSRSHLKAVCFPSIGYNCIDVAAATKYGVYVTNVPDYCLDEVSNHTIMLLLSLLRKLKIASRITEHSWEVDHLGEIHRLAGKTVGLIGLGRIGKTLAQKLAPFHVQLFAADPKVTAEEMKQHGVEKVSLDHLLSQCDIISCHCDLNSTSYHLLSTEEFNKMKPSAVVINTSRGPVIDEDALIQAVHSRKIAGAAIDVVDPEPPSPALKEFSLLDNVIVTPHMAYYSQEANAEQVIRAAMDAARILHGDKPLHGVNQFE